MNKNIWLIIVIFLIFTPFYNQAQTPTITKSPVVETINNQKFYLHTVKPKETLYAISKVYDADFQSILDANSSVANGISIGQVIKIPVILVTNEHSKSQQPIAVEVEISREKSKEIQTVNNKQYFVHTILRGQTIYFLSKLYEVSASEIMETNPEASTNIAIGTKLFIPIHSNIQNAEPVQVVKKEEKPKEVVVEKPKEEIPEVQESVAQDQLPLFQKNKKSLRIVFLLPFFLDLNTNQSNEVEIVNKQKEIYSGTYPFLEYYEGVLLAIDSLRKTGISVSLEVYDTNKDSASVQDALSKIKPEKLDLIIGPIYSETFGIAAQFAKNHKIPIVFPLSSDEIASKNNPYIIQINSPQKYRYQEIAKFASQYPNCNVIHVFNSIDLEQEQVTECKKIFTTLYADSIKKNSIHIKEVYFPKLGISGLEKAMNPNEKNIIVVFSRNQAFINNLVTKLYQFSKKYDIHLIGLPMWEKYENLELDFLYDLQFQFVTNGFIDYSNVEVKKFIQQYRDNFKTEPTKFSFQGFDQMLYFGESIISSNQSLTSYILSHPKIGLHDSFDFISESSTTGIVNKSVNMIQYTKTFERKPLQLEKITE